MLNLFWSESKHFSIQISAINYTCILAQDKTKGLLIVCIFFVNLPGEEKIKVLETCVELANDWKTNCQSEVQQIMFFFLNLMKTCKASGKQ